MKPPIPSKLADNYLAALRAHLASKGTVDIQRAHELGQWAASLGIQTLALAKIHEQSLVTLSANHAQAARASVFFDELITIIESTHRDAQQGSAVLKAMTIKLDEQTQALEVSQRQLQVGISERISAEAALKLSMEHSAQLLAESRLLEEHLHDMTRQAISANEDERKRMSLHLNDEIAQTLLGIHIRMVALKKEVAANHADLTREIEVTQRLVDQSVKLINQLAKEYGFQQESQVAQALAELSGGAA